MSSTKSLPSTVRALLQADPKSTNVTLVERPLPSPNLEKGEHLMRVYAVSPCAGELTWAGMVDTPGKEIITCDDVAGVVVTAPENSPFQAGDEVYARTSYWRAGCARDYAIATTEELARRPQNLSWAESAATALSAETAWQALFKHAGIGKFDSPNWKGKRILVTGASGCVGMWIVQIASLTGAEVVGTSGPSNVDFIQSLGAKEALNYRTCNFKEWAEEKVENKVDLVIDCVGGKSLEGAWWCVRDNGLVIGIREPPEAKRPESLTASNVKDLFFIMEPSGADLAEVTKLIEQGKCRPIVDSVWPLEHFQYGYQRVESGTTRGKVVFDLMMNTRKV
ncbi:hypothetical protein EIK77_009733 [Talaromyces pinophilus]|uniref:Enoyl reductase (ER) domain-containing protein n=1 Tax=Talaromyces pinophilus TaxID=128442 RepID=A0A6V8HDY7_TALPI|nr:hypothetical protein EIK77_009733 [Talaromyces pinophilus]PCG95783.1 Alcohol dehydrogenase superfamily, zinc-type [Penicillium occitanis (nom. inval.)]PCG96106.1 hypothetical protein PENOC_074420 [Penicillium occitanis (nom. inval.)]GAM39483.1 hypothetical protein TCE0_034f11073 [Talaromyces pinophilus]